MISSTGSASIENLIISSFSGIIIAVLLFQKQNSFGQKKFDAIVQMLGSAKGHNILHQFLSASSASFISLLIYLVLSDLTRLISTNFNFLDSSSILSLDNLPLIFLIILGINLASSFAAFWLKKDSNFLKILRS